MIPQREILSLRDQWSLRADVIEKDWALGWLLAGIGTQPDLRSWVFKGGTCLRKCYYETYRFSEDLDFTVVESGVEEPAALLKIFRNVAEWLADTTGLELVLDDRSFVRRRNRRGRATTVGRLAFRGPSNPPTLPKIKIDLTSDEVLVYPPSERVVFHPYSDALMRPAVSCATPSSNCSARSYAPSRNAAGPAISTT